jgi:1-acyl-sn-glycerol-3-phosphate acyltransferase
VAKVPLIGKIEAAKAPGSSRKVSGAMYGFACWVVFCVLGIVLWPAVVILPKLNWRWRLARTMGRLACACLGIPLEARGVLSAGEPCVYVANHASFLDSCAIFVMFPTPVVFVAGSVLSRQLIVGTFLRRVGAVFVGGEDGKGGPNVESVLATLKDVVRSGRSIVFFPEGGLGHDPGLRRFKLGAFVVAAETGCPVVPIGILGTRGILPAGRRLLRRGANKLVVGEPLRAKASDWRAARELANRAHSAVEELLDQR